MRERTFCFKPGRQNPVSEETACSPKMEKPDAAYVFCFDASFFLLVLLKAH